MKTTALSFLLITGLACSISVSGQTTITLSTQVEYLSNTNPYYKLCSVEIGDEIYPPTGTYTTFFTSDVVAGINVATVTEPGLPKLQVFSFTVDTSSSPQLTCEQDYGTDLGANSKLTGVPPSSSSYVTVDVRSLAKGTYTTGQFPKSSVYFMLLFPQITVSLTSAATQYCPGDAVSLHAGMWGSESGLTFRWFYYLSDRSDTTLLTTTTSPDLRFTASTYANLMSVINGFNANTSVTFYCIASGTDETSAPALAQSVLFSPAPPSIGSISSVNSCQNVPTGAAGSINISDVTGGNGSFAYVLRNGSGNTSDCDPTSPGSCSAVKTSGNFAQPDLTISNIPSGPYTLLIANGGGTTGACFQSYNVTIDTIPALRLVSTAQTNVSCPGAGDGSITVNTSGGQSVQYQLGSLTQSTGLFTGLSGGTYTVKVSDGCLEALTPPFTITQPTAVTGSYTQTSPTCNSPANGSISVSTGQGSGTYNYYLYQGSTLVSSQPGSILTNWNIAGLAGGTYSLQVVDAAHPSCSGYNASITLSASPAIGGSILQQQELTCFGTPTGLIDIQGTGGSAGAYLYSITNTDSALNYSNTTGAFSNLYAGNYNILVQSAVPGCTDSYASSTAISSPSAIQVSASATNVQCYGLQDGTLSASFSGGTGTLAPAWQQGGSVIAATASVNGLSPGTYTLSVTDANGCNASAPAVTITQPQPLIISTVTSTNVICFGSNGSITPIASGGNSGYTYGYSNTGAAPFTSFNSGDPFGAGSYTINVTDNIGCAYTYPSAIVIAAPTAPLVFSDIATNISCYGDNDGTITITPSGGYGDYTYAIDGGAYQSSALIDNLLAGNHTIQVKDVQGCVTAQTETLTQPANALAVSVTKEIYNNCADGHSGQIQVALAGGTPPYLYSLSSGPFQTSGTFSNLSSGDYSVTAKDQNGCSLQNNYSILSLYPPITIAQNTQNVSCYGGSNGTITLSVSGGDAPYAFTWTQPLTGATNTQTTLQPGTYVAQITDVNGCTAADTATISQPAPLTTTITSSPVCSNTSGGTITINASGGMPPYTYNSQPDSVLTNLSAGAYTITISDNNGCVTTQQASVSTDTLVPSVEFLVSTQQDALDTLEVEDISVPKPDSIQWAFAPATNIIAPGLIQYSQPGTYPATMTAFYGGCNFSVTENITIQPFDTNTYNPYVLQGQSFDSVLVAPNPNNGVFNLYVKLYKAQTLAMNVFNVSGVVVYQKQWTNQVLITEQETLPNAVPAGVYIVELITDSDVRDYNIIVVR